MVVVGNGLTSPQRPRRRTDLRYNLYVGVDGSERTALPAHERDTKKVNSCGLPPLARRRAANCRRVGGRVACATPREPNLIHRRNLASRRRVDPRGAPMVPADACRRDRVPGIRGTLRRHLGALPRVLGLVSQISSIDEICLALIEAQDRPIMSPTRRRSGASRRLPSG